MPPGKCRGHVDRAGWSSVPQLGHRRWGADLTWGCGPSDDQGDRFAEVRAKHQLSESLRAYVAATPSAADLGEFSTLAQMPIVHSTGL
jgi:hypothetical protein